MSRVSGIYAIRNTVNGNTYIGSSRNISKRWISHKIQLRKGTHSNAHLQSAWTAYGEDHFAFEILYQCEEQDLLVLESQEITARRQLDPASVYNFDCPSQLDYIRRPTRGETHYRAKLGQAQVDFIRNNIDRLSLHPNAIADAVGITPDTMMDILKNRSWYDGDYDQSPRFICNATYLRRLQNRNYGMKASNRKLDWDKVRDIRRLANEGLRAKEIGERYDVDASAIRNVLIGKTWKSEQEHPGFILCPPNELDLCRPNQDPIHTYDISS